MKFNVITIFPELIRSAFNEGIVAQALDRRVFELNIVNPRNFTNDRHKTVDDRPFGGSDGMVMKSEPLRLALDSLGILKGHRVLLSAHGKKWCDSKARLWAKRTAPVTLICGRYGGVDQRFINEYVDEEVSLGDFILSGGELAALAVIDSIVRLLPNVLGNSESAENESFADGLLEAPLFTRPQDGRVPQVFLSGDHERIKKTRRLLSLLITKIKRPDLWTQKFEDELVLAQKYNSNLTQAEFLACGLPDQKVRNV